MARGTSGRLFRRLLLLLVVAALVAGGLVVFRTGADPEIHLAAGLPGIGNATPLTVEVAEPQRGLTAVRVELIQGERTELLAARTYEPLPFWKFWGPRTGSDRFELEVGRKNVENLVEGTATIRVTADRAGTPLRGGKPVSEDLLLPVKLRPPLLQVTSLHTYVTQGGCEAVVYRVGPTAVRDGVEAGEWFFPGYPVPDGQEGQRFAVFSAPYDLDDGSSIRLIAEDDVRNRAEAAFVDRFTPKPIHHDNITVGDRFLEKVVPEILGQTPELRDQGNLLENYLLINRELRKANAATLLELAGKTAPGFQWRRRFLQLPNSQVTSTFADRRTYFYEGREVDRQDHLGFDLASVKHAEIPAANDGVVLLARYFGIYGNAVLLDHGYGLQSLYGHLSSLSVQEGQTVKRGDILGRTGETGLAGGDHLHFTMLLHGLPVNPTEWWDPNWIQNRIALKLGPALPFEAR